MKKYMFDLFLLLGMTLAHFTSSEAQDVRNTSYVTDSGEKVLRQEIIIPASVQDVWKVLTTAEGWKTWATPVAEFELKVGGKLYTHYRRDAEIGDAGTIYNSVLSYVPYQMFSMKIELNDTFSERLQKEDDNLFFVFLLQDVGENRVKVEGSMIGWKTGKEWDETYEKFARGNEHTFKQLHLRFKEGPIDWHKRKTPARLTDPVEK